MKRLINEYFRFSDDDDNTNSSKSGLIHSKVAAPVKMASLTNAVKPQPQQLL